MNPARDLGESPSHSACVWFGLGVLVLVVVAVVMWQTPTQTMMPQRRWRCGAPPAAARRRRPVDGDVESEEDGAGFLREGFEAPKRAMPPPIAMYQQQLRERKAAVGGVRPVKVSTLN